MRRRKSLTALAVVLPAVALAACEPSPSKSDPTTTPPVAAAECVLSGQALDTLPATLGVTRMGERETGGVRQALVQSYLALGWVPADAVDCPSKTVAPPAEGAIAKLVCELAGEILELGHWARIEAGTDVTIAYVAGHNIQLKVDDGRLLDRHGEPIAGQTMIWTTPVALKAALSQPCIANQPT